MMKQCGLTGGNVGLVRSLALGFDENNPILMFCISTLAEISKVIHVMGGFYIKLCLYHIFLYEWGLSSGLSERFSVYV